MLREANLQLKNDIRNQKEVVAQLRAHNDQLQQKSEHINHYELSQAKAELSDVYKELTRAKEELKHSHA